MRKDPHIPVGVSRCLFFEAEDGIRDVAVTGVQTCALPILRLARLSRPVEPGAPDFIRQYLAYGASVRAPQALVLGGKARALLSGRAHVSFDDIRALAPAVFRHRLLLHFPAPSARVTTDQLTDR